MVRVSGASITRMSPCAYCISSRVSVRPPALVVVRWRIVRSPADAAVARRRNPEATRAPDRLMGGAYATRPQGSRARPLSTLRRPDGGVGCSDDDLPWWMPLRANRIRGGGWHRSGGRVQLLDLQQARSPPLDGAARAAAPRHSRGRPRDLHVQHPQDQTSLLSLLWRGALQRRRRQGGEGRRGR